MTPEEISTLRFHWNKLERSRAEGHLSQISTQTLKDLAEQMDKAIEVLSIFPEAETTRYWFCLKRGEVQGIIHFRGQNG